MTLFKHDVKCFAGDHPDEIHVIEVPDISIIEFEICHGWLVTLPVHGLICSLGD
jgi:hypothetical protein